MIRSKLGFKALGLCALVLGLMGISAGAAQAEAGSVWKVAGTSITGATEQPINSTLENNHGILLSKALGTSFNILCTALEFENAVLKKEGGSLGRIRFTGCKILLGGVVSAPCEPHTGAEKGVILTNLLKDLLVLHEGQPVDRLESDTEGSEVFVTIETGAECSVGSKIPVIGKFFLKDCKNEGTKELVQHLGEELAALTKLWVISKTVEHEAHIDGSANVFLTGANVGKTFSGIPG